MPSEVIYGPDGVHARVSWGGQDQETVQLVTQAVTRVVNGGTEQDATQRLIEMVNLWLKDAGEPTIDLVKLRDALPYEPSFDGWWFQFDSWGQVNRLIKVLKRARDRSFGEPA